MQFSKVTKPIVKSTLSSILNGGKMTPVQASREPAVRKDGEEIAA